MNIGDYVRTELGICKYIGKHVTGYGEQTDMCEFDKLDENLWSGDLPNVVHDCDINDIIIKSSPNIIDLIEVGDYVNGYPVEKVYLPINKKLGKIIRFATDNATGWECETVEIYAEDIESIVTKEQFESIEYKVGE